MGVEDCQQSSGGLQNCLTDTFASIVVTMSQGRGVASNSIPVKMCLQIPVMLSHLWSGMSESGKVHAKECVCLVLLQKWYLYNGISCNKQKLPMQHSSIVKVGMLELPIFGSTDELCCICFHKHFLQQDNVLHSCCKWS